MTILKLARYASDEGEFQDVEDAKYLLRRIQPDTILDFSAVSNVPPAFLDALFQNETEKSLQGRITGMSEEVAQTFQGWRERASSLRETPNPASSPPLRVTKPETTRTASSSTASIPPEIGSRFTPARLIQRLDQALRGYIESAYPLSDPVLVRARHHLLTTEAEGHLLAQEPFIETTTRYASSPRRYDQLGLPSHLGQFFQHLATTKTPGSSPHDDRRILYPRFYSHQEQAFKTFLVEGKDIIVSTGTGSGKTECFLVPVLGAIYDEAHRRPDAFQKPAVRALILYPMNALVNDQLARLRLLLGEPAVAQAFQGLPSGRFPRFGMYTGRTPYAGPRKGSKDGERIAPLLKYYTEMDETTKQHLRALGRYPAKNLEAFLAKHLEQTAVYASGPRQGQTYIKHNWEKRLHTSSEDRELLTRHEMIHETGTLPGHSPDILVTNYSMLEYMLMRPFERPLFEETREWLENEGAQLLLVLDEAHMYRGAKGAEVAFLLRRLRARLGIHDRPEKLRIIATSASLGSEAAALENICRFAADLVGKTPSSFVAITGTREIPSPAARATKEEADLLAGVDIEALHRSTTGEELYACLAPLLQFFHQTPSSKDEVSILVALFKSLSGRPLVNQLIQETAGQARPLGELAERVFPGHPNQKQALQALLALGTLARPEPDAPGLLPTRVHGMFRGLHGLYSCIHPRCAGRQADPGLPAAVGKLFSSPRASCDVCHSRVFELASCRSCGTPYLLAYAERNTLHTLAFLWGEIEGDLLPIQLLPVKPRYPERTKELRVHLTTGYLDPQGRKSDHETRSLFLGLDGEEKCAEQFERCPMCQPSTSSKSRIYDFRTRGEQPFTALIEAQFSEQAPQKNDPRLPNRGRKVLVFSDGRQKAARLAPALEHSHARDLFRQVLALASSELKSQEDRSDMISLYPSVVWLCGNRGYNLFPSAEEVEFHNHLRQVKGRSLQESLQMANRGILRPTKSYAQAFFSEITDHYYSLPALALATIEESPDYDSLFAKFPAIGLSPEAIRVLFRAWARLHFERRSFRSDGAEISDLGEGWASPVGIAAKKRNQVLPNRFEEYLSRLFADEKKVDAAASWFQELVRESTFLHFEGDLYYLQASGFSLHLKLQGPWLRCTDCGKIHPESLEDLCPSCCGRLVEAEPAYLDARTGFYRAQVLRAFDSSSLEPFGLLAAEHSAQLTGTPEESAFNKVEEYELRFQDIALEGRPPIDVLSCTTTMEVGIDIGALSGVALRNVPPHVANYQQRAGRAGRRGRSIASVITYAHGTSHDSHFFEHPAAIISGHVRAPLVYIENQQVLQRHIHAYLVQRFFHEQVPTDITSLAYTLFESLGTVEEFLSEGHPCSLQRLEPWLTQNKKLLEEELRHWIPTFSYGLKETIGGVEDTISSSIKRLQTQLREVLPIIELERRDQLSDLEREALTRRLGDELLQTLIGRAVFPRYAFPTDVISFWVSRPPKPGDPRGRRSFDYEPQRDLQIALTEYAPGRSLTIDKWRFESAALFSPYEPQPGATLARRQSYTACRACSFVSFELSARSMTSCPCCHGTSLLQREFLTPAGFASDVNAKREADRGQAIVYAGVTDRARLELQEPPEEESLRLCEGRLRLWTGSRMLAIVNKGVGDRGFRVCPACGRAEPEYGPGFTKTTLLKKGRSVQHEHPLEKGVMCSGQAQGPFYLGHRFPTDTLLLRLRVEAPLRLGTVSTPGLLSRAARLALTSLVEAIALAASRELQIDEGELSGWWTPVFGGRTDEAQLYLYDLLPGGAGYARSVGRSLGQVLDATEALLSGCNCASSCYRCIRHYGNNHIHSSLDRRLALALLCHVRRGEIPRVETSEKEQALIGLCEYLKLRGLSTERLAQRSGITVPLLLPRTNSEIWIDVHHPLLSPSLVNSEVEVAARRAFQEVVVLDAFTLVHALPEAVGKLQLSEPLLS